jgi:hypothetical protein
MRLFYPPDKTKTSEERTTERGREKERLMLL